MKTIGLIGGMSWESTAHYYALLNKLVNERLGGRVAVRLSLNRAPLWPDCCACCGDPAAESVKAEYERGTSVRTIITFSGIPVCRICKAHHDITRPGLIGGEILGLWALACLLLLIYGLANGSEVAVLAGAALLGGYVLLMVWVSKRSKALTVAGKCSATVFITVEDIQQDGNMNVVLIRFENHSYAKAFERLNKSGSFRAG